MIASQQGNVEQLYQKMSCWALVGNQMGLDTYHCAWHLASTNNSEEPGKSSVSLSFVTLDPKLYTLTPYP